MTGTKISALPAAGALAGTEPVPIVQGGATVQTTTAAIAGLASSPTGANPTATAGPAAVNGAASTFMRSDAAPAVQKASAAQFGIVEVDGTTITAAAGVISAVQPTGANPTATAGPAAVNGAASTFMRSDAAPAVQKASAAQFGIVEVDGTTITAAAGVISAVQPTGANPTASVGATAVNGAASTFMRSDGAPALAAGSAIAGPRSLVYAIGQSNTQHSHTGDTNETLLTSVKIPANTLGANGSFRVTCLCTHTGTLNAVLFNLRFGLSNNLTGTIVSASAIVATSVSLYASLVISNRNATNSQISPPSFVIGSASTLALLTSAIDTTQDTYIVISGQCLNAGDTVAVQTFIVEFIPAGGN